MTPAFLTRRSIGMLVTAMLVIASAGWLSAQRGGRGGGGGTPAGQGGYQFTRLETLANAFNLSKDQKKAVKTLLDDAHKGAAPAREALASTHAAIATAITANKGQTEIDAAVKQYSQQAAAMAALEMKALAQVLIQLDPEQRTNGAAVRTAFFLMRGIFLDDKKWDALPDSRSY